MKKYWSFFRLRFINGLQYRAAAYAGIATQFAWGLMEILVYSSFYGSDPTASTMTQVQLNSYIWLRQAFLGLFMSWYIDSDQLDMVSSGNVSYELCRPIDLYTMWFVKDCAVRTSRATLRCFPILIITLILPDYMRIYPPASLSALVMFIVSMALGLCVAVAFSMLIYLSAFYTVSTMGIRLIAVNVLAFLSGELIPIPFFPESARKLIEFLPFASIQSAPFLIYSGYKSGNDALFTILLQIFWLVIMVSGGKLLSAKAVKRVVVQGG